MSTRNTPHLQLSDTQRSDLQDLVRQGTLAVKVHRRATALLALDQGDSLQAVATQVQVNYNTVAAWRDAYQEAGLTMLHDKPRSGRPITIDGTQRAKITALACSTPPQGHARWSLRLLADKAVELGYVEHLSHDHAGTILKKTNYSRT
jgi:putative transposase